VWPKLKCKKVGYKFTSQGGLRKEDVICNCDKSVVGTVILHNPDL